MNPQQMTLEYSPRCVVPEPDTLLGTLLRALQRGERLTVAQALTEYGVYALSQRMGDLRRMGWPVMKTTVKTEKGARIGCYRMESH